MKQKVLKRFKCKFMNKAYVGVNWNKYEFIIYGGKSKGSKDGIPSVVYPELDRSLRVVIVSSGSKYYHQSCRGELFPKYIADDQDLLLDRIITAIYDSGITDESMKGKVICSEFDMLVYDEVIEQQSNTVEVIHKEEKYEQNNINKEVIYTMETSVNKELIILEDALYKDAIGRLVLKAETKEIMLDRYAMHLSETPLSKGDVSNNNIVEGTNSSESNDNVINDLKEQLAQKDELISSFNAVISKSKNDNEMIKNELAKHKAKCNGCSFKINYRDCSLCDKSKPELDCESCKYRQELDDEKNLSQSLRAILDDVVNRKISLDEARNLALDNGVVLNSYEDQTDEMNDNDFLQFDGTSNNDNQDMYLNSNIDESNDAYVDSQYVDVNDDKSDITHDENKVGLFNTLPEEAFKYNLNVISQDVCKSLCEYMRSSDISVMDCLDKLSIITPALTRPFYAIEDVTILDEFIDKEKHQEVESEEYKLLFNREVGLDDMEPIMTDALCVYNRTNNIISSLCLNIKNNVAFDDIVKSLAKDRYIESLVEYFETHEEYLKAVDWTYNSIKRIVNEAVDIEVTKHIEECVIAVEVLKYFYAPFVAYVMSNNK